jgi:dTDP-4-dehydrorhamnose reductase
VVSDQVGTPTYAGDLADLIVKIIVEDHSAFGVYHYSNEGVASWFDFARGIFELSGVECEVLPIDTESYPTAARRPGYSVLDKSKVKETFNIAVPFWQDSLKTAVNRLQKNQGA